MSTSQQPQDTDPTAALANQPHPKGLYVLFFTEMWERFCYYGMRALLMLYMVNYFKWSQEHASQYYKWYTSLVYLTPVAGGYVADRYLGNKRAVIIGAILMSIGEFLMGGDNVSIFQLALALLIVGNGMFKPNMSTQVGRLYVPGDPRRDAAYTIFYMGINLGAALSPPICGYLRIHYGYKYGFWAAGVGMLIGLFIYLIGLPLVKEISGKTEEPQSKKTATVDSEDDRVPSAMPRLSQMAPWLIVALAIITVPAALLLYYKGAMARDNLIVTLFASAIFVAAAWILREIGGAARDKVIAIYVVAVFVVFFWAAFEQAGNAMNLWADQVSDRYVSMVAPPAQPTPQVMPAVGFDNTEIQPATPPEPEKPFLGRVGQKWHDFWNPVSTESFQSINAVAIFVLAPLFAWLWTFLARRGRNPSIPTKMACGILLMSSAFALMIASAKREDQPSETTLSSLPPSLHLNSKDAIEYRDPPDFTGSVTNGEPVGDWQPAQGGRLLFKDGQLKMRGVLADVERDRILRGTAPASFVRAAQELAKKTQEQSGSHFVVTEKLDEVPPGFDLRFTGFNPKNIRFDEATKTITVENLKLADKDYKTLLQAAAEPAFRAALAQLYVRSQDFKVSSWWLVWFYVLSTLGELCLSPVGLSMVSKLAPARFATMLMGIWLLTSFFGNFVAGALGESWGTVSPTSYFLVLVVALGGAAIVLFALSRKVFQLMHGVK